MTRTYQDRSSMMAPANVHIPVTPDDAVKLEPHKVICVGTAGDLVISDAKGTLHTYPMADNSRLDFSATKIMATGTTASGIVLWA